MRENLLVQSLSPLAYQNNPNFRNMVTQFNLPFEAHEEFKNADLEKRQLLYRKICEVIWDFGPLEQ